MATVIEHEIPGLRGQRHLYAQILRDLYQRGLLDEHIDVVYGGMRDAQVLYPPNAFEHKRTTPLGDQFLAFITAPPESAEPAAPG